MLLLFVYYPMLIDCNSLQSRTHQRAQPLNAAIAVSMDVHIEEVDAVTVVIHLTGRAVRYSNMRGVRVPKPLCQLPFAFHNYQSQLKYISISPPLAQLKYCTADRAIRSRICLIDACRTLCGGGISRIVYARR